MRCYLQVNIGTRCQETYESASRDADRRVRQLCKAGYIAFSTALGPQAGPFGRICMTDVTVYPGAHADTFQLPRASWTLYHL